jgi:transcriptional regulator with XRE-family HTH domain
VSELNTIGYIRIIRDLREDADKTQTEIADILGTSQTMYARYERGKNELPIRHLIALSQFYHVSTDYILGLTQERHSGNTIAV